MSIVPLIESGPVVMAHALAALAALGLGLVQLAQSKGGPRHCVIGYAWSGLMIGVALTSFWIHDLRVIGPFSPIHILSVGTLVGLALALLAARRGNIRAHRHGMLWLFFAALIGAGAFTLLPGRVMHLIVFGQ
ncbi:DUF2306 domain-containing protein [Rhodovulum sp. YNF3179]|uniref:DUF2306 domain-containing protein n=1 Tax=Rhodovulum sp. YNF3179 TaxID=3425127 RepID=UPI003D350F72